MASPAAPPFLIKTYAMVDDPETNDTISWNESGTAFVVWRRSEFERDLLPRNFKHSNFASFVRQLNTYGFRKVGIDRWEFANDWFRRGEKHLLGAIHRRKGTGVGVPLQAPAMIPTAIPISPTPTSSGGDPAVSSSPPPPGPAPAPGVSGAVAELEEENARLRRENARLARELARARRVCDGVRHLVSRYDHGGEEEDDERSGGGKPLLFGVAIGSKRSREDGEGEGDEEESGEDENEEREDGDEDERHTARREPAKSRRTEPSDLDVLALSVRAAAAARPEGGSRDRKNPSVPKPLACLEWNGVQTDQALGKKKIREICWNKRYRRGREGTWRGLLGEGRGAPRRSSSRNCFSSHRRSPPLPIPPGFSRVWGHEVVEGTEVEEGGGRERTSRTGTVRGDDIGEGREFAGAAAGCLLVTQVERDRGSNNLGFARLARSGTRARVGSIDSKPFRGSELGKFGGLACTRVIAARNHVVFSGSHGYFEPYGLRLKYPFLSP